MSAPPTRLPDLPASMAFLDRPALATATGLRGQVVAVLFWRAGCVHCRAALAALAALQRGRRDRPFAVLAVHVAADPAERDDDRVRRAAVGVRDAVTIAIDREHELRRRFAVDALPWLALADGDGDVRLSCRGEPNRMRLGDAVDLLLDALGESGDPAAVPLPPVAPPAVARGASAIASFDDRLWIALPARGSVAAVAANGELGREIGGWYAPGGLVAHDGELLVSDRATHELWSLDLASGSATAVLGTGQRGTDRHGGGFGTQQPLSSPAGMCSLDGAVYLAHAGVHQLWQFDPETQAATAWIGSGERADTDGAEAAFAEPLAVAAGDGELFVADAGNGAVRAVELAHNQVRTVAQDLRRPTAVAIAGDQLFVACAWQPAVVRLSVRGGERAVLCGPEHGLVEPVGLALHDGELWVADAGSAALFAIPLDGAPVRRIALELPATGPAPLGARLAAPLKLLEFSDVTLRFQLPTVAGEQLDCSTPCTVELVDELDPVLAVAREDDVVPHEDHVPVLVPIEERGEGVLRVRIRAGVRVGPDALPASREYRYIVPVSVGPAGALEADVRPRSPSVL